MIDIDTSPENGWKGRVLIMEFWTLNWHSHPPRRPTPFSHLNIISGKLRCMVWMTSSSSSSSSTRVKGAYSVISCCFIFRKIWPFIRSFVHSLTPISETLLVICVKSQCFRVHYVNSFDLTSTCVAVLDSRSSCRGLLSLADTHTVHMTNPVVKYSLPNLKRMRLTSQWRSASLGAGT